MVTGGASEIGRAMAGRFAAAGMKVVLDDLERDPLLKAEAELRAAGATVLAVPTDVSDGASAEALAARTLEAFGAVRDERLYTLLHPGIKPLVRERIEDILGEHYPRPIPREAAAAAQAAQ